MDPAITLLTVSREATPTPRLQHLATQMRATPRWVHAPDAGYLEAVLDDAIARVSTPYLLRLDDDEWASPDLVSWLAGQQYRHAPLWKFPRLHRWGTGDQVLLNPPLWPDWQTRLGRTDLMAGRTVIHAGSPHGGGVECPFPIVHDKFLKPYAERKAIAEAYDRVMAGAGTGAFLPFNLPEDVWPPDQQQRAPFAWRDQ